MNGLAAELFGNARNFVQMVGATTRFLGRLIALTPVGLLRFRLIVEQVYNAGALSLVIIMTCGLFVGMVLGLQGYDLLQRFGSEDSLGTGAAVDPMRRVVLPRFLGGAISVPLLTAVFIAVGLFGVQLVGVQFLGVDQGAFWSQMRGAIELDDVMEGLTKGAVFGVACSLVAVYEGYNAQPTAEGVGRATTRTVVISAVVTLILDYILTAIML
jgi:phospholipid/cholesterol/gamma-HCH transport system permease protein